MDEPQEQQPQPQQGPGFLVQGVPTMMTSRRIVLPDGNQAILVSIESANGSFHFPVEAKYAMDFANEIKQNAGEAIRGLQIATRIPPMPSKL